MVYLDNSLDSKLGPEDYTPILQALLLGTRLLDIIERDFRNRNSGKRLSLGRRALVHACRRRGGVGEGSSG